MINSFSSTQKMRGGLTLKAKAVELVGDVGYEASGGPTKAKFGNQVADDAI